MSSPNFKLPTTQKAVLFNLHNNTLSLTSSAPIPTRSNEHLIRVHSTAITNGELTWAPYTSWPSPHIPCYDVSGTILTSVSTSPFHPGDIVYGRVYAGREGTACEYATILPSEAAHVPERLSGGPEGMREAASIPMSAHTAWQGLFEHGLLTGSFANIPFVDEGGKVVGGQAEGERVLVLGVAGGVGLMAVQFAKLAGAYVAGTASSRNATFLQEIGIDEVIDYTRTSVEEWVGDDEEKKFDLVFDCVGGAAMLDGWHAVKPHGTYISVVPGFRTPTLEEQETGKLHIDGLESMFFIMEARGKELEAIGRFIEKGLVRGCVDSVWKLEEFDGAFKKTAGGHARGKVVLQVQVEEQ